MSLVEVTTNQGGARQSTAKLLRVNRFQAPDFGVADVMLHQHGVDESGARPRRVNQLLVFVAVAVPNYDTHFRFWEGECWFHLFQ